MRAHNPATASSRVQSRASQAMEGRCPASTPDPVHARTFPLWHRTENLERDQKIRQNMEHRGLQCQDFFIGARLPEVMQSVPAGEPPSFQHHMHA